MYGKNKTYVAKLNSSADLIFSKVVLQIDILVYCFSQSCIFDKW